MSKSQVEKFIAFVDSSKTWWLMENTKPKINPWTILFLILLIIVIVLVAEYLLLGSRSGKTKVDKLEKVDTQKR